MAHLNDEADPSHAEKEHHTSATRYILIWVALLVFTGLTVFTGRMDLGHFNLPLAMVIATIKATLVVLFFMHMAEQKGANRIVFVVSIFFVLLLIGLTGADVATRFPLANPPTVDLDHVSAVDHAKGEGAEAKPGNPSHEEKP